LHAGIITLRQFSPRIALKNLDFNVTLGFILMRMNEKSLAYSEREIAVVKPSAAHPIAGAQENPGVVDSLLHPQSILIRQLLTRPGRLELNLILIDEEENIIQALDAGVEIHSLYYSGSELPSADLISKLPASVGIYEVAKRTCKKLFENDKVTRVFAVAHTPAPLDLDSLLRTPRDIVALEDLTISGNIGAIVRTSLAFGVGGVVLLNAEPADIYDRRMIRASRGHIFSLPVVTAATEDFIHFCQRTDLPVLVMAAQADHLVQEAATLPRRLAIILGSEKDGCSQRLMDAATQQVQIAIHSKVESLNVSTAAGIMSYSRFWFNHPQARK
jgi:23S rRNA (adenosine1067-2'-O)-methyltransferase